MIFTKKQIKEFLGGLMFLNCTMVYAYCIFCFYGLVYFRIFIEYCR